MSNRLFIIGTIVMLCTVVQYVTAQGEQSNAKMALDNFKLLYHTATESFISDHKEYLYDSNTRNLTISVYSIPSIGPEEKQSMILGERQAQLIKDTIIENDLLGFDFMSSIKGYPIGSTSHNLTIVDSNNDRYSLSWYSNSQRDLLSLESAAKSFESLFSINCGINPHAPPCCLPPTKDSMCVKTSDTNITK